MKPLDFEYDGSFLSDFGFVVCDFNANNGFSEVSTGSNITFIKIPRQHGARHSLVYTKYEQCLSSSFDICKDPNKYDDNMEISEYEFRRIMKWLNRKEFLPFHFVYEGGVNGYVSTCYHNASFNISKLMLDECCYGIRLKVETDAPFGFGEEKTITWSAKLGNMSKTITDESDEIGYLYPTIEITCDENCDFTITNETLSCVSQIKNCKAGEVITMHGDTNIITTSYDGHDICNDFNYEFFRIGNNISRGKSERTNVITVSHPCNITITYSPVIKYVQL